MSQAGVRTKFKALDFKVIVQCVHALFSEDITRFEFVQRKTEKVSAASVYGGHFVNRMPAREGDVNWNYCGDQA